MTSRAATPSRSDFDSQLRDLAAIPPRTEARPYRLWPYGGKDTEIEAGTLGAIHSRGAYRVAEVLAVVDREVLVELEVPQGDTAYNELRIVRLDGRPIRDTERGYRHVRYEDVERPFLEAMLQNDMAWNGQRKDGTKAPAVERLVAALLGVDLDVELAREAREAANDEMSVEDELEFLLHGGASASEPTGMPDATGEPAACADATGDPRVASLHS